MARRAFPALLLCACAADVPSAPDGHVVEPPAVDAGLVDSARPDAAPPPPPMPDGGPMGPIVLNPGWIGGPCQSAADCPFAGSQCLTSADGWPGGTCSEPCDQLCPDQDGPLNSVTFCIDTGTCLSRCDFTLSPTGCRDGYVCLPEKRMNDPATVRYTCVPTAGVPGRPAPAFDIGAPCASAGDCARSSCITDLPGGYCTQEACNVVGCPAGSACFSLGLENYFVCLQTCAGAAECRASDGYTCDEDATCWIAPPAPTVCDLTGAEDDCAAWAGQASARFVVVSKHLRRLAHCDGASLVGAHCVGLGSSPIEDKEREGDRRTPEGVFYIPRRIDPSQYYKAFLISYPDDADAERGLAEGLITEAEHDAILAAQAAGEEPPQTTNLGGLVELHGGGSGEDWTWGCVAADDTTIDELWPSIGVGDTIVILH